MNSPTPIDLHVAVERIISHPAPSLLLDTCALLDIIRGPMRQDSNSVQAAKAILGHVKSVPSRVNIVVTCTVISELEQHIDNVQNEVAGWLDKLAQNVRCVQHASKFAEIPPSLRAESSQPKELAKQLRNLVLEIIEEVIVLASDEVCGSRAHRRAIARIPPGTLGNATNDCDIIEHYLELCQRVRSNGLSEKCVFVSSNTKDFCKERSILHPELRADFDTVDLSYCTNMTWAIAELGL